MKKIIKTTLTSIVLITSITACSGKRPIDIGEKKGVLISCPDKPNCVGSFESKDDKQHYVEAIKYQGDLSLAKNKLKKVIQKMNNSKIIVENDNYIYVEYTSNFWKFVDDVEFFFDDSKKIIHVRSASRIGRSDLGVNRERIEKVRELFKN